jgi:Xaa-Pro dipeptidase
MALHFDPEEFEGRRRPALEAMAAQGLDALLLFKQESMYWLCGYDSFGYCFFQCLVLRANGDLVLTTRAPDLRQAQHTSILDDIRIWVDREGSDPAQELRSLLAEKGLAGRRIGIEYESHGLTAANGRLLDGALDGFAERVDASRLIDRLRLVKSQAELTYVRTAAQLADAALEVAIEETRAGADEGDILAAMHAAIFRGGGDYPGNAFIIGSGRDALLVRYKTGRRRLDPRDQLTLEFAGVYRHYHACLMRTLLVGEATARHRAMHAACREALAAAEEQLQPGTAMGAVFDAQAAVLDRHGMGAHRLNACGYSLGAVYPPSWMDWPMFFRGNPVALAPGMVFFLHMVLLDSEAGVAMTLGRTSLITDRGSEPLSAEALDLVVS